MLAVLSGCVSLDLFGGDKVDRSLSTASVPNQQNGSAQTHEDKSSGFVCRDFKTTRHSFEGVAAYSGQACLSETGEWLMTRFEQK